MYHQNRDEFEKRESEAKKNPSKSLWKSPALSETLCRWLPTTVIKEEISILQVFENQDFSDGSPLMKRPLVVDSNCKGVALSIKYLINLKDVMEEKLMSHYLECVKTQMNVMRTGNSGDCFSHLVRKEEFL